MFCSVPPGGIHIRRGVNSDVWLVASLVRPSSPSKQSRARSCGTTTTISTRLRSSSPCVSPGLREYHHGTPAIGSTPKRSSSIVQPPLDVSPQEDRIQTRHPAPKLPLLTSSHPLPSSCRHTEERVSTPSPSLPFPRVTHTDAPCGSQLQVPSVPPSPPELLPGAARAPSRLSQLSPRTHGPPGSRQVVHQVLLGKHEDDGW